MFLYKQQLGRGLRKTSTKKEVIVVDVVDEYGVMIKPCSMHTIFHNSSYVPFGDILNKGYKSGEWINIEGLHERIERVMEVDVLSFAEKYEGFLSVEQLARELFVSTGTVNSWIRKKKIIPSVSFAFGNKTMYLFQPDMVAEIRELMGLKEHNDETIKDDFFAYLKEREYTLSYKMPFLLSFIKHMDNNTGEAEIDAVLDDYIAFYQDRIDRGLVVDRRSCPYSAEKLADRMFIKRSMLENPFEKFERKRFLYYTKDLGIISINHALQSRLTPEDYQAIVNQMNTDLVNYYAKIE